MELNYYILWESESSDQKVLCGAKVARGPKEEEFVELKWLIPKPLCTRLTFKSAIKNNFTEYLNKLFWNIVERQIKKVISFLFN